MCHPRCKASSISDRVGQWKVPCVVAVSVDGVIASASGASSFEVVVGVPGVGAGRSAAEIALEDEACAAEIHLKDE